MPTLHYVTENRTLKDLVGTSGVSKLLRYSTSFMGDGIKTVFTITHNLNSIYLFSEVLDADSKEEITVNKKIIDNNSFRITFAVAPPSSKVYNVYVMAGKA